MRIAICAIATLAGLGAAAPASAETVRRGHCNPRGSHEVIENRSARVFYVDRVVRRRFGTVTQRRWYGCLRSTGKRWLLAAGDDGSEIYTTLQKPVRLVGTQFLYGIESIEAAGQGVGLGAIDLAAGPRYGCREPYCLAGAPAEWDGDLEVSAYTDAEVTPGGSIGWIATGFVRGKSGSITVVGKSDADGDVLLDFTSSARPDRSPIPPKRLRLVGNTLSWRHAGEVKTVVLRD